jgi:hypothetical protein
MSKGIQIKSIQKVNARISKKGTQNSRAKKVRSAPRREDLPQVQERTKKEKLPDGVAYRITDAYFPDFDILTSANAWWLDRAKVMLLIAAYKGGAVDIEACAYAGITVDQYKYFKEKHPQFSQIKQLCLALPDLRARTNVVNALDTDRETAKWWLSNKLSGEFSPRQKIDQRTTLETGVIDPEKEQATKKLLSFLIGTELSEEQDNDTETNEKGT